MLCEEADEERGMGEGKASRRPLNLGVSSRVAAHVCDGLVASESVRSVEVRSKGGEAHL